MIKFDPKQPYEEIYCRFGFANDLENRGDSIGSIESVTVIDRADGTDMTATMYDATKNIIDDTDAYVFLKAGTDRAKYQVTVRIEADVSGQKFELDAILPVREI